MIVVRQSPRLRGKSFNVPVAPIPCRGQRIIICSLLPPIIQSLEAVATTSPRESGFRSVSTSCLPQLFTSGRVSIGGPARRTYSVSLLGRVLLSQTARPERRLDHRSAAPAPPGHDLLSLSLDYYALKFLDWRNYLLSSCSASLVMTRDSHFSSHD